MSYLKTLENGQALLPFFELSGAWDRNVSHLCHFVDRLTGNFSLVLDGQCLWLQGHHL